MKKLALIPASLLLCSFLMVSCSSNKLAVTAVEDNLYFMSSDMKKATQYAVANNLPDTFEDMATATAVPQDNFSSKNINPEYLSRYGQINAAEGEEVVYFDEQTSSSEVAPNIDIYNSFIVSNFNSGWSNSPFNYGFSPFGMGRMGTPFGMGMMGFSPFGMGMYDPFFNPGWGWRSGFNVGLSMAWGRPMYSPWNSYMGFGGMYDPFWGGNAWGSAWSMGRPIYATGPIIILPGSEYADRRIVYGARPSRGSYSSNGAGSMSQQAGVPSTARAQARENVANSSGTSPRRVLSSGSTRSASRDFSSSQNDYYSTGRSRVETNTRNVNSAASDRGTVSPSRNSAVSARPSASSPASGGRTYSSSPSRSSYTTGTDRSTSNSPSYTRSTGTSSTPSRSSSGGRNESSTYSSRSSPSRSSNNTSTYSAPSRSSSAGSSSAPSRSTSGSSGSSSSGGSRGRGN